MAAISAFRVTQHSQNFSLFFRNRIQCIALYKLHNSQALLNLRRGYYRNTIYRFPLQANLLDQKNVLWRDQKTAKELLRFQ